MVPIRRQRKVGTIASVGDHHPSRQSLTIENSPCKHSINNQATHQIGTFQSKRWRQLEDIGPSCLISYLPPSWLATLVDLGTQILRQSAAYFVPPSETWCNSDQWTPRHGTQIRKQSVGTRSETSRPGRGEFTGGRFGGDENLPSNCENAHCRRIGGVDFSRCGELERWTDQN